MAKPSYAPWAPLDCSPSTMTDVAAALGVNVRKWRFVDVLGLEPTLLAMLPRPCIALILLYPTVAAAEAYLRRDISISSSIPSSNVVFMRQRIGGMCGTIAVLHALANNLETVKGAIEADTFLAKLDAQSSSELDKMPEEEILQMLMESKSLGDIHASSVAIAGTRQGRHFLTFTCSQGSLLELDGRREYYVNRGPTTPKTFLGDAAVEIRKLMNTVDDLESKNCFSLVAFVNATNG